MSVQNPISHFFTQLTSTVQLQDQTFGPVQNDESNRFRTTAKFTATSNVNAYAICTGQVFIQPSLDTTKINLILRPYKQPINGLSIKYFVYRGLNKSDFLQSGAEDKLISHQGLGGASEFMNVIWVQLKKFNDWEDSDANNNDFLSKWIGYDPNNQLADTIIDDYFFMANEEGDGVGDELKPFEFPLIKIGTHLGNFSAEYGLDIVLSDGDYKALSSDTGFNFDLNYARATEGILDITNLPINTTEKQYRETIFNFISPSAYFGLHFNDGKILIRNGEETIEKEGQLIYNEILINFLTKNNVYIYLQSDLGRSFNYYENYNQGEITDVLKLGIDLENMQIALPTTNSWPLLIQNQQQTHTEIVNTIHLQLAVLNEAPLCYGQIAKLEEKAENNFLVSEQLIPIQPEAVEGEATLINIFSQPITFFIPTIEGTGDIKNNVASFVKLIYLAANMEAIEDIDGGVIIHPIKTIDTLFNPINISQRFSNPNQEVISWCGNYKNNLINSNLINEENTSKIVTQTKIIFDKLTYKENEENLIQDRIVFETQNIEGVGNDLFDRINSVKTNIVAGSLLFSPDNNNFYKVDNPHYFETKTFTDSHEIKGIQLLEKTFEKTIKYILGITRAELNEISNLINITEFKNGHFFFKEYLSNGHFISLENIKYVKYKLGLIIEGSNSNLKIIFPSNDIVIYSLDRLFFYSKDYVNRMPELRGFEDTDKLLTKFKLY